MKEFLRRYFNILLFLSTYFITLLECTGLLSTIRLAQSILKRKFPP